MSGARFVIRIERDGQVWFVHALQPLTNPSWTERLEQAKTWASASAARKRANDRGLVDFTVVAVADARRADKVQDALDEHRNAYAEPDDSKVEQLHDVLAIATRGLPVNVEWTSTGGGCMAIAVNPLTKGALPGGGYDDRQLLITGLTDVLTYRDWDSDDTYDGGFHLGRYDNGGDYIEDAEAFIADRAHCPGIAAGYDCTCDHEHPDAADEFTRVLRKVTVAVLDATDQMLAERVPA